MKNMNIVLLFAFIILSCGERGNELALTNGFADLREHKSASAIKEGNTNTFEEILEQSPPESSTVIERKLIKNGDITFETANVKKTKIEIEKICLEFNA